MEEKKRKIDDYDIVMIKKQAERYQKKNTEIREGQALYLAASDMFPISTNKLDGKECDCFYEDKRMPMFIDNLKRLEAE